MPPHGSALCGIVQVYVSCCWFGSLLLLCFFPVRSNAQGLVVQGMGQVLKETANKVYPACIRAYGIDSVSLRQNSAQFSAVVVSTDGYILTVAHAIRPGERYKVSFPDGKEGYAQGLGRLVTNSQNTRPDVAMMKMEGAGPWPYAEMGWSSSLEENQYCFGISYPESLRQLTPMLRFGRIVNPSDRWGFVESTCIMETGDSGGPLFDALGRVVALHSRIDQGEGISFEVPVDTYRKYWTALHQAATYDNLPDLEDEVGEDSLRNELVPYPEMADMCGLISEECRDKVEDFSIRISSRLDAVDQTIIGTVFHVGRGKQLVISKSSCVGEDPTIEKDGKPLVLRVLYRDERNDLVALEAPIRFDRALELNEVSTTPLDLEGLGAFLYSPLGNGRAKIGVVGMPTMALPARFSSGVFEAALQEKNGYPTVVKIDQDGVAMQAGLEVGDQVFQINDIIVASAGAFNHEMMKYFPGNTVQFSVKRGQDTLSVGIPLIHRVHREQNHPMNRFEGGKSIRRDGFEKVFIHDSRIHSYECGSPVFDADGKFVGMNISRFSHVACVALTADTVVDFIRAHTD